jgi:hypothetical protein
MFENISFFVHMHLKLAKSANTTNQKVFLKIYQQKTSIKDVKKENCKNRTQIYQGLFRSVCLNHFNEFEINITFWFFMPICTILGEKTLHFLQILNAYAQKTQQFQIYY